MSYVRDELTKRGFELVDHGMCWRRGQVELSAEAVDELEADFGRMAVNMALHCLDRGALGFNVVSEHLPSGTQLTVTVVPHGVLDKLAEA